MIAMAGTKGRPGVVNMSSFLEQARKRDSMKYPRTDNANLLGLSGSKG